ncbi:hypothetical protein C7M84_010224 [Penaeus vannamei]|uniref:Clusterin-associated protein 1 n=1 Tax=Penaeus vannamei TaxID=6689 RepID=A0A423T5F5_PENVA|nr:hypothetical protein C7M84_010224 [Penaeus vannamei]
MLRSLGFRRLISVENFRSPNFPLVSEILVWLVGRFDPSADLPTDVDTEQDRVIFVRSVAQFMAAKAHVRLNTKKLYQSDGYAVQEILKALTLLYDAIQSNAQSRRDFDDPTETTLNFDVSNKVRKGVGGEGGVGGGLDEGVEGESQRDFDDPTETTLNFDVSIRLGGG